VNSREVGIGQKIGIEFDASAAIIRPYFSLGIARGLHKYNIRSGAYKEEAELFYGRLSTSLGFEAEFSNGPFPFVQYNVSKMTLDNVGERTVTEEGVKTTTTEKIEDESEREVDTSSLLIGLGYTF
jgi:hypothetical protein